VLCGEHNLSYKTPQDCAVNSMQQSLDLSKLELNGDYHVVTDGAIQEPPQDLDADAIESCDRHLRCRVQRDRPKEVDHHAELASALKSFLEGFFG
jgi:hypothetical protein